ncbi:MAG: hypothetical protein ABMA64_26920 [Myxococcota bacterium]
MWLLCVCAMAWAGRGKTEPAVGETPGQSAERVRLGEDLRKLAGQNQWGGVERAYVGLLAVSAATGAPLTHAQHVLGAQAAEARGDVRATWERLKMAVAVEPRDDTREWIARLEVTNGLVSIRTNGLVRGPLTLEVLDPPDPSTLRTIDAARAEIEDRRRYDGFLPLGRYRVGSLRFDVDGGPPQQLVVPSAEAPEESEARILRIDANGAIGEKYATDLAALVGALAEIEGVAEAGVVPPPVMVTYVDFTQDQLDALGITATDLGRAVREQLGLLDTYLAVRPTTLAIRSAGASVEAVTLPLPDGRTVGLPTIATTRIGPDDASLPAGVWLDLDPGADLEAVRTEAAALLRRSAPLYFR